MLSAGAFNGGVKVVVWEQLRWIVDHGSARIRLSFITNALLAEEIRCDFPDCAIAIVSPRPHYRDPGRWWMGQWRARRVLSEAQVVYAPLWYSPFATARRPAVSLWVDALHRLKPESLPEKERHWRDRMIAASRRNSAFIQTISETVAGQLIEQFGVVREQVVVTRLPLQGWLHRSIAAEVALPAGLVAGRYFLYPANLWPHKNHQRLLRAFARYAETADNPWCLVLTGFDPSSPTAGAMAASVQALPFRRLILMLGHLSPPLYASLFKSAGALVFPSEYEGFGMPLVEAMSLRVPVICSDLPVLREVAEGAAAYVDAGDEQSISAALRTITADPQYRRKLADRGALRCAAFSMTDEMEKLVSVLMDAAKF